MKFPTATLNAIADACNVSYAYACSVRGKMRKDKDRVTALIAASNASSVKDTVTGITQEKLEELIFKAGQGRDRTAAPKALEGIDATLAERGGKYGKFKDTAAVIYKLKSVLRNHAAEHDKSFSFDQAEALDMICHKLGRIVNGDPDYADSWVDIAGYAKLVADRLESGKEV